MPLLPGVKNIGHNITEMQAAGHPFNQARAAALHTAYGPRHAGGGSITGPLMGTTDGRADQVHTTVPDGAHIIPADVVAALGSGNNARGQQVLSHMFPHSSGMHPSPAHAAGGTVPVRLSDGEFAVSPEEVVHAGNGNADRGHDILDQFILHTRKMYIDKLKKLPPPVK